MGNPNLLVEGIRYGELLMLSIPPAIATSTTPFSIYMDALAIEAIPEEHTMSIFIQSIEGEDRPLEMPVWM